jgi:NTP pyrophosphatase (non-canonical NTP hydrolase)
MMGLSFHTTLRDANTARQVEWDTGGEITPSYQGNEMAGEIGEALELAMMFISLGAAGGRACNIIKKLERERFGMVGSRASLEDLADELADVVICADLVAMKAGIDLDSAVARKFNKTSEKNGQQTRLCEPQPFDPDTYYR